VLFRSLGNNATGDSPVPVAVDTSGALAGKTFIQISAGANHTCGIASGGQAYCWGDNSIGQLGNNSTAANSLVPVAVDTSGVLAGQALIQIAAGGTHVCALAADRQVYCWGVNTYGQFGNSAYLRVATRTPVATLMPTGDLTPVVTVGGVAATNVTVAADGVLTFTAPAMAAGTYDLVIDYGSGIVLKSANALTYGLRITSSAVSVPALHPVTLALLGLLLAGGVAVRRRKV
jgi:hypothetical protein